MDSYLNDSRFKLHYFAAFAEVFENLPFDLQKRSLVSLINDSQYAAFSVFREASSAAYVALASLPGPSMEVIITRLLLYSRLNDLLKQRDVRAEPFPTLLPKFLKAAEKTKSLPNLSYFFEFQPTMPDAKSLEVFAALDADAAIKYIFKHQRFDTNSLAVLRALATKNKQPYLLMKSLIENPHFPNRTAWLESLIQSKSGLEILMRINVSKGTLNIFSPKDPAFQPVMRAALQNSKNKDLLKLNPDWVNALTLATPSKTQINHPLCRQVFQ
jgi:hypothetical protein